MSNYKDCMCRVCEQKRVAAAEVDKLKGMMIKPMSADHETKYVALAKTQEDVEQLKLMDAYYEEMDAAAEAEKNQLIADLQAKILKQDKQFAELAQENKNHKQALIDVINVTGAKIKDLEETISAMLGISDEAMKDVVNAAGATIADLRKQIVLAEHEKEFWRLRAEINAKPVTIQHHIDFAAASTVDTVAMRKAVQQLKSAFPLNGGCV